MNFFTAIFFTVIKKRFLLIWLVAVCLSAPTAGLTAEDLPEAYVAIAAWAGVPAPLLYALARQESARPGYAHPWPWTANIAGRAHYFESRAALFQALQKVLQTGHKQFDVGLMQISWRHNAHLFADDLWQATDPYRNLYAGAYFLKQLKERHGSFEQAVGRYHAGALNTPARRQRAERYRERVRAHLRYALMRFSLRKFS